MKNLFLALLGSVLLLACSKKSNDTKPSENKIPIMIEFDNIVGGKKLLLDQTFYTNQHSEQYNIQKLQYFISNIILTNSNGSNYVVPQDSSYFLVKQNVSASKYAQVQVPEGDYTHLTFTLGVDSLRNTKDLSERTGVLDPSGDEDGSMYWGWNSGYIFFMMEGSSNAIAKDATGLQKYRYHIGGFGGYSSPTINNIKTIKLDLRNRGIAQVRANRKANIHLLVDIAKVLDGTNKISLANNPQVMFSAFSVNVANNFVEMFTHDHTEN